LRQGQRSAADDGASDSRSVFAALARLRSARAAVEERDNFSALGVHHDSHRELHRQTEGVTVVNERVPPHAAFREPQRGHIAFVKALGIECKPAAFAASFSEARSASLTLE
jgi:hypothetical protein